MGLEHFYHVYAAGQWQEPLRLHFDVARNSGLLNNCQVRVGMVGNLQQRAEVRQELDRLHVGYEVVAEADTGWEQVTLTELWKRARLDLWIFYAHTKGAGYPSALSKAWRHSMTFDNVTCWRDRVADLRQYEVTGSYWLKSTEVEHQHHDHFFAGNFWWARGSYIANLPEPAIDHRYQAEGWIGLGRPRAANAREGLATFGNFYQGALTS